MHRYLLCMCFSALCIVEFYLTIKLHAHKYGLTEIRTLQLFFFSLASGMMEGFQVCEGLLEKKQNEISEYCFGNGNAPSSRQKPKFLCSAVSITGKQEFCVQDVLVCQHARSQMYFKLIILFFKWFFFIPICFSLLFWADEVSYEGSSVFLGTDSQGQNKNGMQILFPCQCCLIK